MDLRDQLQSTLGTAYTLERELGGGGMSRVFVATETALGRQVVVKVLPSEMTGAVSIDRFKREISLAAQLQHPHIVPLLTAGDAAGLPYFTMPFIKGESLRARITQHGELPVSEAVRILREVASALAFAHEAGVVHRDIKPDNVLLSAGSAMVTDFGVAKALSASTSSGASGLTSLGVALGTPAYMSPEQATADPLIDHRADVYAFGAMAYEMLSGQPPFAGRPPQAMLAAHVNEMPEPLVKRRANVPPALSALVMRCLEKRAADRPQSAAEIVQALDAIITPSGGLTPTGSRIPAVGVPWRSRRFLAVAAIVVAVGAAAYLLLRLPAPYAAGNATQVTSGPELEVDAAISPDGKFVAYAAGPLSHMRIYVRQVGGGRTVLLTGEVPGDHRWPRWAPDGSQIVFSTIDAVYVIPALGGTSRRLFDAGPHATPSWSPDGRRIAYANSTGIWVRSLEGGAAREVVRGPTLHSPVWSPDGRRLAYVSGNTFYVESQGLGNIAFSSVWSVSESGGAPTSVTDAFRLHTSPAWSPDGRSILYVSNQAGTRDVYQQRLGLRGRPAGEPVRLTTGLNAYTITLSADGKHLAYSVLVVRANIWWAPISAGGPTPVSAARPVTSGNQVIEAPALSHDGKWLAYDSNLNGSQDIYKLSLAGGEPIRLTRDPADEFQPAWSPSDREIAFHGTSTGSRDIFVVSADGGNPEQVTNLPSQERGPGWSPDGTSLCFASDATGYPELYVVTRAEGGGWSRPRQITSERKPNGNNRCQWSPDGQRTVFDNDGSLKLVDIAEARVRVLVNPRASGGFVLNAQWGRDPEIVFFNMISASGVREVWSIPVSGGAPRLIIRLDSPAWRGRSNGFCTDGSRLFFSASTNEAEVWVMELKR